MCLDYSVAGAVVSRLTPYAGKDVRLANSAGCRGVRLLAIRSSQDMGLRDSAGCAGVCLCAIRPCERVRLTDSAGCRGVRLRRCCASQRVCLADGTLRRCSCGSYVVPCQYGRSWARRCKHIVRKDDARLWRVPYIRPAARQSVAWIVYLREGDAHALTMNDLALTLDRSAGRCGTEQHTSKAGIIRDLGESKLRPIEDFHPVRNGHTHGSALPCRSHPE